MTSKPFGVGVVLAFSHEQNVKVILEEKVAVLQVYWGEYPAHLVNQAHEVGVKVVHQVCAWLPFPAFVNMAARCSHGDSDTYHLQSRRSQIATRDHIFKELLFTRFAC